jgi:hypothetical protein
MCEIIVILTGTGSRLEVQHAVGIWENFCLGEYIRNSVFLNFERQEPNLASCSTLF